MATITVKNIPDDLYERLKQAARAHRRSINSEVIVCIERAVGLRQRDVEARLSIHLVVSSVRVHQFNTYLTYPDAGMTYSRVTLPTEISEHQRACYLVYNPPHVARASTG